MPVEVSRSRFDALVKRAASELPDQFARALENIRIDIRDRPTRKQLRSVGLGDDELLLGLYEGTPLTERHVDSPPPLPDVIYLFQQDIEDACESEEQLAEEVRITLLHEIGHYFGLDEDELTELGYG